MEILNKINAILNEGKEEAEAIRKMLKKELGLSARDVSVKSSRGGFSSSVNVKIKTMKALVLKSKIEEIASEKESYERDIGSGEILMGGNTFIFTEIDWKFRNDMIQKIHSELDKVTKGSFEEGDQVTIFKTFVISNRGNEFFVSKKGGGTVADTYSKDGIGSAVMLLIHKLKDDNLYLKIK